jgi:hypothetical protein
MLQANLNANYLDGLSPGSFWMVGGNSPGATGVLGTRNNYPLEFKVNDSRALRLEPGIYSPNIIGGYSGNWVTSGVSGATISGGGDDSVLNRVTDENGTVAGGVQNQAGDNAGTTYDKQYATVGGGYFNTASGYGATVSGGYANTASGDRATVGGGYGNLANGQYATVSGGLNNVAAGSTSFAAGNRSRALQPGAFVWADNNNFDFPSTASNQFRVRSTGGAQIVLAIDGSGNPAWTCSVYPGSTWQCSSDRNLKENLTVVSGQDVLARVADMPVYTWSAKGVDPSILHMGPMAQDFYAAFGLGDSDKSIATIDLDGVSLAAIQGLYRLVTEQKAALTRQQATIQSLEARLAGVEAASGKSPARQPLAASLAPMAFGLLGVLAGVYISRRGRKR